MSAKILENTYLLKMTNYYFLTTALPPLQLGVEPDISFYDFSHLLKDNLSKEDYAQTVVIRRFYDLENLRAFWKKETFDKRGNFTFTELENSLISHEGLPSYIYNFVDAYETTSERLRNFSSLLSAYYYNETALSHGFLKQYLIFEHHWRLVFTGFRAKQLGRDLATELQFEDPNDDLVAQILAQKDANKFIAPDGYEDLQALFEKHAENPLDLYQALCAYRFAKVEQMVGIDLFSIDRVLAYMVQLIMVEKWMELDKVKGLTVVNQVVPHL